MNVQVSIWPNHGENQKITTLDLYPFVTPPYIGATHFDIEKFLVYDEDLIGTADYF